MAHAKKPRQETNGYRPPAVVADLAALDADLQAFVSEKRVVETTRENLERLWRVWERHCVEHKADPLDAPWAAWQELEGIRREDGRRYADVQLLGAILNAVEHRYRDNGVTSVPAPRQPEHKLDWRAVCREWETVTADARGRSAPSREPVQQLVAEAPEVEVRDVVPMLREDALALLAVPLDAPCWSRGGRLESFVQQRARLLVALDTRAAASQLEKVTLGDIEVRADGSVAFGDFDLPCDHRERVRGVPWDCSACSVREAVAARPDDDPETSFLLMTGPDPGERSRHGARNRVRSSLVRIRGRWGGLQAPLAGEGDRRAVALVPRADLTARELAGLRRGLVVVEAGPSGPAWLVGRPWVGVAWAAGFRMGSDLARLPRRAAQPLITGEPGILLRLGATKSDQGGEKPVKRPFTFAHQPIITQALVEYLAVRDAAVGDDPDGPLFISAKGGLLWPATFIAKPNDVASALLAALTQAAGLDKRFTSYSTRKGYVAQAESDGWKPERTKAGMRHVREETTFRHYRKSAPKKAARKFVEKALEASS